MPQSPCMAVNYCLKPYNNNHTLPCVSPQTTPKRVAIIGAGATGLAALRVLSEEPHCFIPTVFERSDRVGGLWNYTPGDGPVYKNLRTNLCVQGMMFPGFPFPFDTSHAYPTHAEIARYLHAFADSFSASRYIKFRTTVIQVQPTDDSTWLVAYRQADGSQHEDIFDAVLVCNGHFDAPYMPKIPGLSSHFPGEVIHSREYDNAEAFRGKRVVVLGGANSGQDIALEISATAKEVLLSHNGAPLPSALPANMAEVRGITACEAAGLRCADGSLLTTFPDVILCATGYNFSLSPLLAPTCGIQVEEGRVFPLYKNLVNAHRPSMFFLGLLNDVAQFPMYYVQSLAVRAALEGRWQLPSIEEMLRQSDADYTRALRVYGKPRHVHLMRDEQWAYNAELSGLAGYDPEGLPSTVRGVFNACWYMRRHFLASFRSYSVLVDPCDLSVVICADDGNSQLQESDLESIQAINEGRMRHPAAVDVSDESDDASTDSDEEDDETDPIEQRLEDDVWSDDIVFYALRRSLSNQPKRSSSNSSIQQPFIPGRVSIPDRSQLV